MKGIKLTQEDFIQKSTFVHGEFDYSKVIYKNAKTKVEIICSKHGSFMQRPDAHLSGQKCMKCKLENHYKNTSLSNDEFIKRCINIHQNTYDYSKVNYIHSKIKIDIICKKHGIFSQKPMDHIRGQGCRKCKRFYQISKPELEISEFIISKLNIDVIISDRKTIQPYELDIYIPSLNKAIEFNGLYWHYSKKYFKPGKHAYKSNLCREKGIKLLHVREDLWLKDKEKVKDFIVIFLNK